MIINKKDMLVSVALALTNLCLKINVINIWNTDGNK